ncbi:hypothetical protein AMTRI_Chr09g36410 [Amborella trichopoda]
MLSKLYLYLLFLSFLVRALPSRLIFLHFCLLTGLPLSLFPSPFLFLQIVSNGCLLEKEGYKRVSAYILIHYDHESSLFLRSRNWVSSTTRSSMRQISLLSISDLSEFSDRLYYLHLSFLGLFSLLWTLSTSLFYCPSPLSLSFCFFTPLYCYFPQLQPFYLYVIFLFTYFFSPMYSEDLFCGWPFLPHLMGL